LPKSKRKTTRAERLRYAVRPFVGVAFVLLAGSCHSTHAGARAMLAPGEPVPGGVNHACVPSGPERCFDARDDNCNGIIDEGCGVRTGVVQFAAAWDKSSADVDLDVIDPSGELAEVGRATQSGLVKERDCPGTGNECHGQNLENVYLEEGDAARGRYRVRIRLEKLGKDEPPVHVTLGARVGARTYSYEFQLTNPEEQRELIFTL
jgi:tRNA (guanosine-2'-O-)-methyltransferase